MLDADLVARQVPRERKVALCAMARMASERFPGKVILPLAGMPLWWHVMRRMEEAAKLLGVEVAGACIGTGVEPHNDILEQQARQYGYDCVRQDPEPDVVGTFLKVCDVYDVDTLITGGCDSPFAWYEHMPGQARWYWETGWLAQPRWEPKERDPLKTVIPVAGVLGLGRRVDLEAQIRLAKSMDERQCAFLIQSRRPEEYAAGMAGLPPRHMLFDYSQEMYDLWRWWTLEVDNYEDGVMACILYDMFYDDRAHLVDTRAAIKFVDLHPEWHYNAGRGHSKVNQESFAFNDATRDDRWLQYCEHFTAPEDAVKLRCRFCNEFIGYTVRRGGMDRLHRPDGTVVTGDAEITCRKGHFRVWRETVNKAITSGSIVTS